MKIHLEIDYQRKKIFFFFDSFYSEQYRIFTGYFRHEFDIVNTSFGVQWRTAGDWGEEYGEGGKKEKKKR